MKMFVSKGRCCSQWMLSLTKHDLALRDNLGVAGNMWYCTQKAAVSDGKRILVRSIPIEACKGVHPTTLARAVPSKTTQYLRQLLYPKQPPLRASGTSGTGSPPPKP